MSQDFEYRAFISYSHRDEKTASWLQKALESYKLPAQSQGKRRVAANTIGKIFRDRNDLSAYGSLNEAVEKALRQSEYLIVICSPAAVGSKWVNEEIRLFKAVRGERWVLPIIVGGEPFCSDPVQECFPEALRYRVDEIGRLTNDVVEPIASSLRDDGRKRAKLKILSTLAGVKLDDFLQRDHQRQVRRLALVAAASVVGLVVTTTLSIVAYRASEESDWQREQAENLIEFMLTELREKLEPVGRLDVLDSVGWKAREYYASLPRASLGDDSLSRGSRALILIGEISNLRGNLDDAKLVFKQAYETTGELLSRSPEDPQRLFEHAQSIFWIGYLDWQRGNFDGARSAFLNYEDLAVQLVAKDPANVDWIAELGHSRRNLGVILLQSGRIQEAEEALRRSLEGFLSIVELHPHEDAWQLEIGQGYAWLADALLEARRFNDANSARTRELQIYERLLAQDERNNQVNDKIVVTYRHLGELALATGRIEEARSYLELAVESSRSLLDWEPDNTLWMEFAGGALLDLAALRMIGEVEFPLENVLEAVAVAEELNQRDADVMIWRVELLARAQLYAALNLPQERRLAELNRIIQTLVAETDQNSKPVRHWLATAYRLRALYGDRSVEDWQWLTKTLGENDNLSPLDELMLAEAMGRVGRTDSARQIVRDLELVGFAHPELRSVEATLESSSEAGFPTVKP